MITFDSVRKRYGAVRALDGVSFTVERGEVFGYIGPNGAGKTTSIKIITGLVRDYEGAVLVEGSPIEADRQSFHRRVGYLPQTAGFQEWRTVQQALVTFGRLSGVNASDLPGRIAEVSGRLGLTEHLGRRIVHLSGGMQQRLRFAQAILHRPEIIILDEPLSGLDPSSRAELKRTIRELAGEEHTIMLSSHVLADVEDLADRIELVADPGADVGASVLDVMPRSTVERVERAAADRYVLHVAPEASAEDAMHTLLERIVSARARIHSVRHLHPTLEEVYLSLTEASHE